MAHGIYPLDHYAQSREGLLYAADGWSAVRRWDGLTSDYEEAGVPAPENAPLFTAHFGPGFLTGSWTAYARYLDRYGNPGNPSPASLTVRVADISGTVEAISNATPVRVTSTGHGLVSGGRTDIPGTSLGSKIVIRWPDGTEETLYYDVISANTFDLYYDNALTSGVEPDDHRQPAGQWAQNASGFTYVLPTNGTGTSGNGTISSVSQHIIETDAPHGLSDMGRLGHSDGRVQITMTGPGSIDVVGTFYFQVQDTTHLRLFDDDALTSPANIVGVDEGTDIWSGYNWAEQAIPETVERVQILRTKSGSAAAAYVDQEGDRFQTFFESALDDGSLGESVVLIDPFTGDASYSQRFGLPPKDKPFLAAVGGRMLAAGDPVWTRGAVKVTEDSETVEGIGTDWEGDFEDRLLTVQGSDRAYRIASRSGQTLTLTEAYEGDSAPYASYAISPSYRSRRFLQWSEAGYAEAWYALAGVILPADHEGGAVTGLASFDAAGIVFAENRAFRFSFVLDPATDGSVVPAFDRGAINNRCHVRTESAIYALDHRGVYRTTGRNSDDVSETAQDVFAGKHSEFRIQWKWKESFHACFDPQNESILFFVSLTGGLPRHVLAYRLRSGDWEILEFPVPITCSAVARIGGRLRVIVGTEHGRVLVLDEGERDGATEGTLSGSVSSAGYDWLEDSSAAFSGCENAPVRIVEGQGAGQERLIVACDGTRLDLDTPWNITPDSTSRYVIGGITWRWKTGWYRWAVDDTEKPQAVALTYKPSEVASRLAMRLYADQSDEPKVMGVSRSNYGVTTEKGSADIVVNATKENGYAVHQTDRGKETRADGWRRVAVELVGTTNGDEHAIYQVDIIGAVS